MKVEDFLRALQELPLTSPIELTGGRPFVVLSPHPDDESLGAGGLIAAACAGHERVEVVVLTDGSGSHPRSVLYPRDRLIALRREECARAVAHLGLPDGRVTHLNLPDTLAPKSGPAFEEAVERIVRIVDASGAGSAFVTWGRDPHCDHESAELIARAVRDRRPSLRLWSYPIWGWHLDPAAEVEDPAPSGFRIEVTPWMEGKRAALRAHASQMTDLISDDPEGFRFDEKTIAPFTGPYEYFFEVPA
ncbi:PIG-L deacetylase family protein [Lichenifustis flavocetrariae]|uniref:PIG-L family deacetylase n=1 Tax=Lichenifustis flavocetrariae TaxID=2949735 RepID=A0AA42CJG5_9HYPH|nr:PIG-L deacetylase family protein [Lichenifustis flavocetrariae]MCW6509424.1 PIG-L family deacetylase [Lichenifustis flavocetrariae]